MKKVPDNAILVLGDTVRLCHSIPHNKRLDVLKKQLDDFDEKSLPTKNLVKMAEFNLKNNYFEVNSNLKHQISGTAIAAKFAPPYACMYIYGLHEESISQKWKNSTLDLVQLHWRCFFIWTAIESEVDNFLERLDSFHPNLEFSQERSTEEINFLDVTSRVNQGEFVSRVNQGEFIIDLCCKPTDGYQNLWVLSP